MFITDIEERKRDHQSDQLLNQAPDVVFEEEKAADMAMTEVGEE